jgi:hypothetical protein
MAVFLPVSLSRFYFGDDMKFIETANLHLAVHSVHALVVVLFCTMARFKTRVSYRCDLTASKKVNTG